MIEVPCKGSINEEPFGYTLLEVDTGDPLVEGRRVMESEIESDI